MYTLSLKQELPIYNTQKSVPTQLFNTKFAEIHEPINTVTVDMQENKWKRDYQLEVGISVVEKKWVRETILCSSLDLVPRYA